MTLNGVDPVRQDPLRVPPGPTLERRRLVAGLVRAAPDIVLIAAPAGYGKTTLVRQWVAEDGRKATWLALHEGHASDDLRGVLGAAIGEQCPPNIVVLDDLHRVTAPEALEVIRAAAASLPVGCTLVVAGRSLPKLSLGMVRSQRTVLDLDARDLAFDDDEVTALAVSLGLSLPPASRAAILDVTEGWPAALGIALREAAHSPDPTQRLAEFAGDDRYMVELLDAEVLDRLPSETIDFLIAVAPLPRISGSLCDAVLGRRDSALLLEQLAGDTLVVLPLDHRRTWYRFHRVLHAFLCSEQHLRRGPPRLDVLTRAGDWFVENGDVDSAIEVSALAYDSPRATALVLAHFSSRVGRGRPQEVERWLQQLESGRVGDSPSLQAVAALVRLGLGDSAAVVRCMRRAAFGLPEPYPEEGEMVPAAAGVAALHAGLGWYSAGEMRVAARYARKNTKSPIWYAASSLADGAASFMMGDLGAVDEPLGASVAIAETHNSNTWALALAVQALVQEHRGHRADARRLAREARGVISEVGLEAVPQLYLVHLAHARFEAAAGNADLAVAERDVGEAKLGRCLGLAPWAQVQAQLSMEHVATSLRDASAASAALDAADRLLVALPDASLAIEQVANARRALAETRPVSSEGGMALSAAERRVLQYLPTHLSLAEIAERLYVSRHTVKSHVVAVYRKLGVAGRSEAVSRAKELDLLDSPADV